MLGNSWKVCQSQARGEWLTHFSSVHPTSQAVLKQNSIILFFHEFTSAINDFN